MANDRSDFSSLLENLEMPGTLQLPSDRLFYTKITWTGNNSARALTLELGRACGNRPFCLYSKVTQRLLFLLPSYKYEIRSFRYVLSLTHQMAKDGFNKLKYSIIAVYQVLQNSFLRRLLRISKHKKPLQESGWFSLEILDNRIFQC